MTELTAHSATTTTDTAVRVHADHAAAKRLGNWTTANAFDVRVRHGAAVIDLRSPGIAGDIELHLGVDHGVVKLLLPDDAVVDHWGLQWSRRGRVKGGGPAGSGRTVRLTGLVRDGEVRVLRGGTAIMSALFSREFVQDARRAHRAGGQPTVHDPAR